MWTKLLKASLSLTFSAAIALCVGARFVTAQEEHSAPADTDRGTIQLSRPGIYASGATNSGISPVDSGVSNGRASTSVYETLGGWLTIGISEEEVQKQLGKPEKGKAVLWGALGTYVQQWRFPDQGVALHMELKEKGGPANVLNLKIERPSIMKTSRGIGVGDPESSVLKRYSGQIDFNWSRRGKSLVVGSIYGGTIFTIDHGRVSKIFVGAAAE